MLPFSSKIALPLAVLAFGRSAFACSTGNFLPLSNANELYYVDTTSTSNLLITTYFFGSDCTQSLPVILIKPGGGTVSCTTLQEPGDNAAADVSCPPLNTFVDGQYEIQFLGNVQQYNDFRVTTKQQTVTVTPTATIIVTPLTTQTVTNTVTQSEAAIFIPPAVTSPATIKTKTVTPPKSTVYTTSTWTKTIVKVQYTAVPKVVTVPPICKIEKPPRCPTIPKKLRFSIREDQEWYEGSEAVGNIIEDRSNDLVKRDGANRLQPWYTTTVLTVGIPTTTQTAAVTSTLTQTDIAFTTTTSTQTLPAETIYTGKVVVTVTKPTPTVTRTKYTSTVSALTKIKTTTFTIKSTTSPSPAEITKCRKAGGHYVY